MQKDAFYFSHDSNAKDDPKIMLLIEDLGMEGYGIYWVLIELLRDQPSYKYHLGLIKAIARKYNTTEIKVKQVVTSYNLFVIDEDMYFYSESLIRRMDKMNNLRKKRSDAGKKGNLIRWNEKSQSDNDAIANHRNKTKQKEKKQKEKKQQQEEKEINVVVEELKNKIEKIIKSPISFIGVENLLVESGEEKINYYLDNWCKFKNTNKGNITGFFIRAVENSYVLPEEEAKVRGKPIQSQNYEQREYEKEELDDLYANKVR